MLENPFKTWHWHGFARGGNQAGPTINVWYPMTNQNAVVGEIGGGVRIYTIRVKQSNDEVAAKDIEVRVTIEGVLLGVLTIAALVNNLYTGIVLLGITLVNTVEEDPWWFLSSDTGDIPLECSRFLAEMRITSAVGTNQQIEMEILAATLF